MLAKCQFHLLSDAIVTFPRELCYLREKKATMQKEEESAQ
jgi:hypothetical protein